MDLKLYTANELVRLGCNDCEGCFSCCTGMGRSIQLNPYDLFELMRHLNRTFEQLLAEKVELGVEDGLILPNLKMCGEEEQCGFLDAQGRCAVHAFRPGLCRLFPLGRDYSTGSLRYFLLADACGKNRTKIKISKWLDIPSLAVHEQFLTDWHGIMKKQKERLVQLDDAGARALNMEFLTRYFLTPYDLSGSFYEQFAARKMQEWG